MERAQSETLKWALRIQEFHNKHHSHGEAMSHCAEECQDAFIVIEEEMCGCTTTQPNQKE